MLFVTLPCVTSCVCSTMLRFVVVAVKCGMVLYGDIVRLFKIYSTPRHSSLWTTNTFPTGQVKRAIVSSGRTLSLTAIKE